MVETQDFASLLFSTAHTDIAMPTARVVLDAARGAQIVGAIGETAAPEDFLVSFSPGRADCRSRWGNHRTAGHTNRSPTPMHCQQCFHKCHPRFAHWQRRPLRPNLGSEGTRADQSHCPTGSGGHHHRARRVPIRPRSTVCPPMCNSAAASHQLMKRTGYSKRKPSHPPARFPRGVCWLARRWSCIGWPTQTDGTRRHHFEAVHLIGAQAHRASGSLIGLTAIVTHRECACRYGDGAADGLAYGDNHFVGQPRVAPVASFTITCTL